MTTAVLREGTLSAYAALAGANDELLRLRGQGAETALTSAIDTLTPQSLHRHRRDVARLVADDGVTYGTGPDGQAGPWHVDPLPLLIGAEEWAELERGIDQRARLLDALLTDLSTEQRVLHERIVPAQVVVGHAEFRPITTGIRLPGPRQLPMLATDLARAADGSWTVLSDRTQAPSGAGYAMANRRIVARVLGQLYRDIPLRRLRPFFDFMRQSLLESAPPTDDLPQVVLLTPGPGSETAYDQALLATMLGHPLAQSDDLVLDDGRLWLRTTGRRHQVDVVQRRVDAAWCDSLDLRAESRLGVPGMVAAARRGVLGVVNPFGAGLVENPGLFPFLPAVCRTLLGEDLLLTSPQTWWCGDERSLAHVREHLTDLVIHPTAHAPGTATVRPGRLDAAARETLLATITATPWAWVAQEAAPPSTAPLTTDQGLEPRPVVLRTFGVSVGGDYRFLPGGLARIATDPDTITVTNRSGAVSKDVWVVEAEDSPAPYAVLSQTPGRARRTGNLPGLTPRGAGNLFWTGRYSERTQTTARLLMVVDNLVEDNLSRSDTPGHTAMETMLEALTQVSTVVPGFTGPDAERRLADPLPLLRSSMVDARNPGTVAHSAARMTGCAHEVREVLATDTFGVLTRLGWTLSSASEQGSQLRVQEVASRVVEHGQALAGIDAESVIRDEIYAFQDAGRRIERAQMTCRLVRTALATVRPPNTEALVTEAVLRVGDSIITYRRRLAAGQGSEIPVGAAVHLLLTDPTNPRSVFFSLQRLAEDLVLVPDAMIQNEVSAIIDTVAAIDAEEAVLGDRGGLATLLDEVEQRLRALADRIEHAYFDPQQASRSFLVPELS